MNNLLEWKHQIGEDAIYAMTKYVLTDDIQYENIKKIKINLFSWIQDIQSKEEYEEQFFALKRWIDIIHKSGLFLMIEELSKNQETTFSSSDAIKVYRNLERNTDFLESLKKARMTLPKAFAQEDNYRNGVLMNKIKFLEMFYEEATKLYENLEKEVYNA